MDFQVGDKVYVNRKWVGTEECSIKEIQNRDSGVVIIKLQFKYGSGYRVLADIFKTYEEANNFLLSKIESEKETYRKQITDIPSLVEFMFDNTVAICEEYTDWEARAVVIEKAKELVGLELEY